MEINCLKVTEWEAHSGLLHGFLGRRGGKSKGLFESLNLSFRVGDEADNVRDNICDVKKAVGIHDHRIVTMKQVHGANIIEVKDQNHKETGEADGLFTAIRDVYLGVLTADCVPILFVVPEKKIAAAVHAGWRGTVAGLAGKMVHQLSESFNLSADEIEAALGPAIGSCCYEVKDDVTRPLLAKWQDLAESVLQLREGKRFLDLRKMNRILLQQAGIPGRHIYEIGPCTACSAQEYFSYRREKRETGRQMSFIGWREA
jgi:hypothetical protein